METICIHLQTYTNTHFSPFIWRKNGADGFKTKVEKEKSMLNSSVGSALGRAGSSWFGCALMKTCSGRHSLLTAPLILSTHIFYSAGRDTREGGLFSHFFLSFTLYLSASLLHSSSATAAASLWPCVCIV